MSEINNQIVLAAIAAAGPIRELTKEEKDSKKPRNPHIEWDQSVKAIARSIKLMLAEDSGVNTQLGALDKCIDKDDDRGKVFRATILNVELEQSSKRAKVLLHTGTTKTSQGVPEGCEYVRTERTDNPDGRAIARLSTELKGHQVFVYVEIQPMKNSQNKARVVQHFVDLGADSNYDRLAAAAGL